MRHRKESASQIAFRKDNMILTEKVLDEIFDRGKKEKTRDQRVQPIDEKKPEKGKKMLDFETQDSYE